MKHALFFSIMGLLTNSLIANAQETPSDQKLIDAAEAAGTLRTLTSIHCSNHDEDLCAQYNRYPNGKSEFDVTSVASCQSLSHRWAQDYQDLYMPNSAGAVFSLKDKYNDNDLANCQVHVWPPAMTDLIVIDRTILMEYVNNTMATCPFGLKQANGTIKDTSTCYADIPGRPDKLQILITSIQGLAICAPGQDCPQPSPVN